MVNINNLAVKIFADTADKASMLEMYSYPFIKGLTTNPSLMRKAGVHNYSAFAKDILSEVKNKSVSFEVFSDDFLEMEKQALKIAAWGDNVYVKIPIMNTQKEACYTIVKRLSDQGIKLNITAVMTLKQVRDVMEVLNPSVESYISIFAGRIADTGIDPVPMMAEAVKIIKKNPKAELIWASSRELLNIFQASEIGCHIITVMPDIIKKLSLVGYDLEEYSLTTVKSFYHDGLEAGFSL